MTQKDLYPVPADVAASAHVDNAKYQEMYQQSVSDPEGFWAEQGKRIDWIKPYTQIKDVSYAADDLHIKWYYDGTLNACASTPYTKPYEMRTPSMW